MKKFFLFAISALMAVSASAIPARRTPFTVRQSDGTTLTLQMVGDEHFHYFVNVADGRIMLQQPDGGDYYYTTEAALAPMRAAAQTRREAANARRVARLEKRAQAMGIATTPEELANPRHRVTAGEYNTAMKGSKKGLVILMEFTDKKFLPQNNRETYERVFNQEGYREYNSIGSVHDYFKDQSYGQFDLTFDVVGPYTADNRMSYYGANEAFPYDPYGWGTIQDLKACQLPIEAVRKADPDVNFKDYDWDGDGEVDQIYIIYPGYAESSGGGVNTIWPHEATLSGWAQYNSYYAGTLSISTQRLDGVKIDTYAMSQELTDKSGSTRVGIGTACHEFAHCLGFPDFYDINQACFGMEAWDIMDNGGYNGPTYNCEVPAGFTAYERWMSGWLEPTVLSEGTAVTDMKPLCDEPEAYVIYNEGNRNEYLLLENRQPKSWHKYVRSWSVPGGMLVTHVDFDKAAWKDNQVNTTANHQRMTPVPSGKSLGAISMGQIYTYESDYRAMLFPGSKNVTELTDKSHGACGMKLFNKNTNGTYYLDAPLHDISVNAAGNVSFVFKEGPDDGNRWTVSFNPGTGSVEPTSWTQTKHKESVTLPTATISNPDWKFVGWTDQPLEESATQPATLYLSGTLYQPTTDVTLYAVYGYYESTGSADDYVHVTSLRNGANYVFASKGAETDLTVYAFNALNLVPGSVSKTPSGKAIELDFAGPEPVIHNPAANLVWTATVIGDNVRLTNEDTYLQITSAGFTLSADPVNLTWHTNYGLGSIIGSDTYYAHVNSGKFNVSTQKLPTSRLYAYETMAAGGNATKYASSPSIPDGISSITTSQSTLTTTFDLQGRQVNPNAHGLYIHNGKKVIR